MVGVAGLEFVPVCTCLDPSKSATFFEGWHLGPIVGEGRALSSGERATPEGKGVVSKARNGKGVGVLDFAAVGTQKHAVIGKVPVIAMQVGLP